MQRQALHVMGGSCIAKWASRATRCRGSILVTLLGWASMNSRLGWARLKVGAGRRQNAFWWWRTGRLCMTARKQS